MTRRNKILAATAAIALLGMAGFSQTSTAQRVFGSEWGGGGLGLIRAGTEQLLLEVDRDRDGKITQAEIDAAVGSRFERFDSDRNGRLSLDEFTLLWTDLTRPVAVRAFQFLDPNGDGGVSRDELNERFSRVVARLDRNGDGVLSSEDRRRRGDHRRDGMRADRGGDGSWGARPDRGESWERRNPWDGEERGDRRERWEREGRAERRDFGDGRERRDEWRRGDGGDRRDQWRPEGRGDRRDRGGEGTDRHYRERL